MGFVVPRCPGLDDRTERQVGRPNLTAFHVNNISQEEVRADQWQSF